MVDANTVYQKKNLCTLAVAALDARVFIYPEDIRECASYPSLVCIYLFEDSTGNG